MKKIYLACLSHISRKTKDTKMKSILFTFPLHICNGFCKISYYLLIFPPPTFKIHIGENKIDHQSRIWRQYTRYFPANGSTNPDVFQPKTFLISRGIIPQNFRSLEFALSELSSVLMICFLSKYNFITFSISTYFTLLSDKHLLH